MNRIIRTVGVALGAALALAGTGASVAADLTPEAKDVQVMNARRENRILTTFNLEPRLHAYDLTVIVDGSSVALGGLVESDVARDLAAQLASTTNGIEHVDNRIRVDAAAAPRKHASTELKGG
ncbi:MAG TPA: BON domain-containing protein [Rhodanobacteraceae bacterium]|jgi:osmotically-inducible protein OsmY|nr:BON domain-containing protein [Rhodanobacteraceae bacterium]